jgi:MFS family permease
MANLAFMTFWGKRTDKAGNMKVLKVTSVLVPLVPLLWIGSHQLYYLIPVQILSGFAWAGFNLASANFVYDASPSKHRMQYIAVFNATNGSAICFGGLLGGYLALCLPSLLGYQLLTLFLVSGLLRGLVAATLLRRLSEVRQVPETSIAELLFGKPSFAWARLDGRCQSVFYPVLASETNEVHITFSLPPACWQHHTTAPSRDPPTS